ncbi:hypothetical protein EC957_001298 [Mortierella hygrophila]|uniref:Uncharacterized protein n=1 Tax=Mortierella hygrophila TaxID=979708 RepID=A0A9P6K1Z0_9FUNG|nr:hypothetical protein EC957_001298 [Mortierella hygrophila]
MKIATISIALVAMTLVFTEALTLHARGSDTASSGRGKNGVDTFLSSTSHTVKRTTPDYSSSSLTTLKDRLVTKRQDKKDTEPESTKEPQEGQAKRSDKAPVKRAPVYTCQEYINGIEAVLKSVEVSMDEVHKEVTHRKPAKDVLSKLTKVKDLVTQTRTDTEAAKKTMYKTKTTMDTLVSTATSLYTKLGKNRGDLGEARSQAYKDLTMNAGNIKSYAKDYVKKGCVVVAA